MIRPQSHLSRQFVAMTKRCAILYAVMLAIPLATLGISAYRVYVQLTESGSESAAFPVDAEARMFPFLFLVGVIWFVGFFDVELCHGVSRRSFANVGMIANVTIAAATTLILMPVQYAGALLTRTVRSATESQQDDLLRSPLGVLLYLQGERSGRFQFAGTDCPVGTLANRAVCSEPVAVPFDWLYMSMKIFSMMLIVASLGMLAGALIAWAFNGGVMRWAGGSLLLIAVVAVYTVAGPWWYTGDQYDGALPRALYWVKNLLSGSVIRDVGERQVISYVAWIPFVFSLLLFAVCAFAVDRMTARREIRPSRRHLIG
ncbi:hypothetical protein [Bifidobacterium simiiventris]|uniref:hypothetical protein n=1 Tax=Bifidobacterium simiiventris TaxID=2834434 RepID=UPI001C582717|nr:hypothetical protein [Bifidobacterium simiiventris]MBW3078869.1 hypothetical protein [Bifidobacterium simiiventris]